MRKITPLGIAALIVVPGLVAHSGCGGSNSAPTEPSAVVTPTTPPTAPPTAAPAAPLSACDRLERVTQKSGCDVSSGSFTTAVSDAIDRAILSRPDLFELTATNERGDPHIRDQDGYYDAVIAELDAAGLCAARIEPTDNDIHVTNSYDSSDRFQIMTGRAYPWRGKASYIETCHPAAVPKAEPTSVDWIFVTAYGARCDPGFGITNAFVRGSRAEIPMGCEADVTATPKAWGGLDVPLSVHGTEVTWEHVTGHAVFWIWKDQPFNITVSPRGVGPLKICATVQGVRGCLDAYVVTDDPNDL